MVTPPPESTVFSHCDWTILWCLVKDTFFYLCFLVSLLHVCFGNPVCLTSSSLQSIYVSSVETNPNKFGRSDEACYICIILSKPAQSSSWGSEGFGIGCQPIIWQIFSHEIEKIGPRGGACPKFFYVDHHFNTNATMSLGNVIAQRKGLTSFDFKTFGS